MVDDVVREFPVTAGMVLQRQVASVKAVSGVSFAVGPGPDVRAGGRVGLRQDHAGQDHRRPGETRPRAHHAAGHRRGRPRPRQLRRFRKDLQMMFQDPIASLDPRMRVGALLREPMKLQGVGTRRQQDKVISDLLGEVGLPANAVERFPHEFSGGQRQRIGLARALTLNPQVIVADEPVSALDVSIRSQVLNLMKRIQRDHGLTYVVISHDLAVVKYMADTIGVMYLGKLVEVGSGDDIYRRPVHHYTAALIAAVPEPDPTRDKSPADRRQRAGRAAQPAQPALGLPVPHPVPGRPARLRPGRAAPAPLRPRPYGGLPLPPAGAGRQRGRCGHWLYGRSRSRPLLGRREAHPRATTASHNCRSACGLSAITPPSLHVSRRERSTTPRPRCSETVPWHPSGWGRWSGTPRSPTEPSHEK